MPHSQGAPFTKLRAAAAPMQRLSIARHSGSQNNPVSCTKMIKCRQRCLTMLPATYAQHPAPPPPLAGGVHPQLLDQAAAQAAPKATEAARAAPRAAVTPRGGRRGGRERGGTAACQAESHGKSAAWAAAAGGGGAAGARQVRCAGGVGPAGARIARVTALLQLGMSGRCSGVRSV